MKRILPWLSGYILSISLLMAQEKYPEISLRGQWWINGNTLHLKITNIGNVTILLEDASGDVPHEELKTEWGVLPNLIQLEDEFHMVTSNKAYWLSPDAIDIHSSSFEWNLKLSNESAKSLNKRSNALLTCSHIGGSYVRESDMSGQSASILLTRFEKSVMFRPRIREKKAEQDAAPNP